MDKPRLEIFAALVGKWSEKINLVSRNDLAHLWTRHVEDFFCSCRIFRRG